jgi:putative sterol carrier protein
MGFPMEMDRFPGKIWVVSHKPIAVAAGLGQMGIHRNVIHPKFGNFILLGTILLGQEFAAESQSCYTHNYREFMGGFGDWVEQVADSRNRNDYRRRGSDSESASVWQSLSFGANYKAAYCLSVCPAGEDVIAPWLDDRQQFMQETLRPLQEKEEAIYAIRGSDAADHVTKRFPHKKLRFVNGTLHATTIDSFLKNAQHLFQPGQADGLDAVYHFTFSGSEQRQATFRIQDRRLEVEEGHHGTRNLHVRADSKTWLKFLAREIPIAWALLTLRVRLSGSPTWLLKFGKCFPS